MDRMSERAKLPCMDCDVDTFSICEYYMVTNPVWHQAVPDGKGFLCIACLEERLGRELTPEDFPDVAVNDATMNKHSRLLSQRMDG